MAIAQRGAIVGGNATNGGNITITLPSGLQPGDVVIVGYVMNAAGTGGTSSGGWTQIGADVTNTARIQIFRKVMGATPDANMVLVGTTGVNDSSCALAVAFSGVDTGRPEGGVALTSATGSSTNPDPPAITPIIGGSASVVFCGMSNQDTTGVASPTGYSTFVGTTGTDTNLTCAYMAFKLGLAAGVSENPSTWTGVSTTPWAVYTLTLAPAFPMFDCSVGPNVPPVYLRKALTAAAVMTSIIADFVPLPPVAAVDTQQVGFHNERHQYSPAKRSVELLGDIVYVSPPPPQATPTDLWWTKWQEPPLKAQLTTALRDSGWQPLMPPRVPETEFQDGWRSRFGEPPVWSLARRTMALLGDAAIFVERVPDREFQDGWRSRFEDPPRFLTPRPRLEGQISWEIRQPEVEYQEGWRSRFTDPPKPAPRSPELLGDIQWPGVGYSFVATQTPTDLWWGPWQGPPQYLYAKRSQELLTGGGIAWNAQVPNVEYQEGWRSAFSTPSALSTPRRATNLLESWPWPGYGYSFVFVAQTPSDFWYPKWQEPLQSLQPRRSVGLLGYTVTGRVPEVEYQEGWRAEFTRPARLGPTPRQEGYVAWPGFGYSFVAVTYQEGWRSPFSTPLAPRRSVALLGDDNAFSPQVPNVEYQEGWRSTYSLPPQTWTLRRQQGFVAFAGTQGLPVTLSPGPWSPVPAATFLGVRTRIVTAWPWQALQFTPPTPTPSIWWRTQWTDPPKAKARAVYLRDDSWGSWAPQFIIQVVPTPPLVGVSFTFGVKTGPSAVPGTKPGATLQSQRKGGGFSLITRVKPRIS